MSKDTVLSNSPGQYDIAIVGSGGAAMAAAIMSVEEGAKVVMVERGTIGGTCVNIGCVPSKTLLRGSEIYQQANQQPFYGLQTSAGVVDLARLVKQKDTLVESLRKDKYVELIEQYGWELLRGEARFIDEETLQVGERHIKAHSYIVATGADPAVPNIPGLAEAGYLTSTSALSLNALPKSLFIIGAGYIALELGQLFSRLGTKVTISQRSPLLLGEYEPQIGGLIRKAFANQGIKVIAGAHIERLAKEGQGRKVYVNVDGIQEVHEVEQILVATGRQPNTSALSLEAARVEVDERGAIRVDDQLRTSNARVWAAGDVTLGPQFVYVAAYEGKLAAENALRGSGRTVDFTALPGVIFTHPQIAVVGLTEAQAKLQGLEVKSTTLLQDAVPRAQVNHDTLGLIKLVAEAGSERILGVHIVSENAGDVIYAGTLAVKFGITIDNLIESFVPYLTMAEGLKLAAQSFKRDVHLLSCCAA